MKRLLFSILMLLIISPGFAENNTFTNDDLIIYSDEYMNSEETTTLYEDNKENTRGDEKGSVTGKGTDGFKDQRETQLKNLTGEPCNVLYFSSRETNYSVHNPDYGISGTITRQTVTVNIQNTWNLPLWVEKVYISAFFKDGTKQTKKLQRAPGDSLTSWIQPETEYAGYAIFDGDMPIVSVGCRVMK